MGRAAGSYTTQKEREGMFGVSINEHGVNIDGKNEILLCASLFYFRLPRNRWEERIVALKKLGYNAMDVYFPWNFHEIRPKQFEFTKERDVDFFLELCEKHGMYVIARPGPYICSEWNGGGLPPWVCSGRNVRQNDGEYLKDVFVWYENIFPYLRKHQRTAAGKGCIILIQLENELDFFDCKDIKGMIGALRKKALSLGIAVPLFCCAGQGDIRKAGGCEKGIYATYNFYPDFPDANFDKTCREYAVTLRREKNLPLLISETGREHSLLKRELMAGAKLLGAYNQVAGSNFGYYQAVNNWGSPEAIITTRYDFNSMISTLGDFTKEADEALLFSAMLQVYGQSLSEAAPSAYPLPLKADFAMPTQWNALKNEAGESFLSVTNLSERNGRAAVVFWEREIPVEVAASSCSILPMNVHVGDCDLVLCNYEIVSADEGKLVFCGLGSPFLLFKRGHGREIAVTKSGTYEGIEVEFLSKAEAVALLKERRKIGLVYTDRHETLRGFSCERGRLLEEGEFTKTDSLLLSDNEIWYGGMEIELPAQPLNGVFLQNVSDFLTVLSGTPNGDLYGGESVLLPPSEEDYRLRVEAWGHCNFDDPRTRSLRIGSTRGIGGAYAVDGREELPVWRFTTYPEWRPWKLGFRRSELHPRLSLNSWNSTRVPLIGLYYTEIHRKSGERVMLRILGGEAEIALYTDGVFMDEFHFRDKVIDITDRFRSDRMELGLLVRKREWTQPTGRAELLYLSGIEKRVRPFDEKRLCSAEAESFTKDKFPLSLKAGETEVVLVELGELARRDIYGVVQGEGYKLTAVYGGKVIARMVGKMEGVCQQGGSDTQFLIPSELGGGKLKLVVEALKDATLDFSAEYNKDI